MPERVPNAEKRRRRGRLMAAARDITLASNRELIGQELDVLVEGRPEDGSAWYAGRSYPRRARSRRTGADQRRSSCRLARWSACRIERALAYDLLARPCDAFPRCDAPAVTLRAACDAPRDAARDAPCVCWCPCVDVDRATARH